MSLRIRVRTVTHRVENPCASNSKISISKIKSHYKRINLNDHNLAKIVLPGVSIISCTNRPGNMENVFANYLRQSYFPRELIIILNNNLMEPEEWKARAVNYPNVKVFQLDEQQSLGACLNFAILESRYDYIAKFDDDDYYAPAYLEETMPAFFYTDAGVLGKCSIYVYFANSKTLVLLSPNNENSYVDSVRGATMLIKKELCQSLRFQEISLGEDTQFLIDCARNGIKIYSTDRFNYINIRQDAQNHTWQLDQDSYLKSFNSFQHISHTDNFLPWIRR